MSAAAGAVPSTKPTDLHTPSREPQPGTEGTATATSLAEAEGDVVILLVLLFCAVKGAQQPGWSPVWVSLNFGSTPFTHTIYGQ